MDEKTICLCIDDNVSKYMCVLLKSICISEFQGKYTIICLYLGNLDLDVFDYIEFLNREYSDRIEIQMISFPKSYIENGYEIRGISKATYIRLFIPEFLPELKKIIYLDVDTIVCGGLDYLWQCESPNSIISGTLSPNNLSQNWIKMQQSAPWNACNKPRNYINAGVLIVNADLIRQKQLCKVWGKYLSNEFVYQDQDIINMTCDGFIQALSPQYNVTYSIMDDITCNQMSEENLWKETDIKKARDNPMIIHYAGKKPWNDMSVFNAKYWWNIVLEDNTLCKWFSNLMLQAIHSSFLSKSIVEKKNSLMANLVLQETKVWNFIRQYNSIAVYGWGDLGKLLYSVLERKGIEVSFIIDKNANSLKPIVPKPIFSLESLPWVPELIVITIIEQKNEIKKELLNCSKRIVTLEELCI